MRIGVGTANPVKIAATEDAVADLVGATVESIAVESGVSEQPYGHAETIEGAETRAERTYEAGDFDLGVGIEGGVAEFEAVDGLFLVMWAAVTDGTTMGRGSGPSLRLPTDVAQRIENGEELGPVMDDLLDTEGVARDQGAAGVLTANIIDRQSALESAIAGALGPFVTGQYQSDRS
ncbi:MAG TPA: inosine/xanthosine triphosphatase [Natrialbaceae archaeon]|nr:inosine/xanthosine triphosphatase [Natrialbaceae archaeon]